MSSINVEPKDIVTTESCSSVSISITGMEFGKSASFNVILFNSAGRLIRVERMEVSGDDYNAWTNDDSYIVSFILAKYGLTPSTPPPPPPPSQDADLLTNTLNADN